MYKIVIWATDGSDAADAALVEVRRLVDPNGRIVAAHCDQLMTGRVMEWSALSDEDDRLIELRREVAELRSDGFDVDLVVRRTCREPADVIAAIANELRADIIVCGTRGRGAFSDAFLGSFTHRLLRAAHCPVLAVPNVKMEKRPNRKEVAHA